MANVMSKFLNMGMSLQQVIAASTWRPAQVIKREELGHLSVGAEADIAQVAEGPGKPAKGRTRVDTLKGGDYLRVWINRGGNHYLIHLPAAKM